MASKHNFAQSSFKSPAKENRGTVSSMFKTPEDLQISSFKAPVQDPSYEQELLKLVQTQIALENNLEQIKTDLSLRTDFNLIDAFRIFDEDGKGWISICEIADGLKTFGVFTHPDNLNLFVKRYDKDKTGKLKYSDFCDAFLPVDHFHAQILVKKAPLELYQLQPRDKIFYEETRQLLQEAWNIHLQNEVEAERLRIHVTSLPNANCFGFLQTCDGNRDSALTHWEIKDFLMKHAVYVSEKEISTFVARYDREKKDQFTYARWIKRCESCEC